MTHCEYSPHGADLTFSALQPRTKFILRGQSRGQQANSRKDCPLSPLQDNQQEGSDVGPRWQIIVWLHIQDLLWAFLHLSPTFSPLKKSWSHFRAKRSQSFQPLFKNIKMIHFPVVFKKQQKCSTSKIPSYYMYKKSIISHVQKVNQYIMKVYSKTH